VAVGVHICWRICIHVFSHACPVALVLWRGLHCQGAGIFQQPLCIMCLHANLALHSQRFRHRLRWLERHHDAVLLAMPSGGLVAMPLCVAFVHHAPACRIIIVFTGSLLFGLSAAFVHHMPACNMSVSLISNLMSGLSAASEYHVPACRTSIVFIGSLLLVFQQPLGILCLHAESALCS